MTEPTAPTPTAFAIEAIRADERNRLRRQIEALRDREYAAWKAMNADEDWREGAYDVLVELLALLPETTEPEEAS